MKSIVAFIAAIAAALALMLFYWYGCRIEVESGQLAVLVKKTGKNLPSGEIIAPDASHKGIQLDVLPEGRYFRNPLFWDWQFYEITTIPANSVGVQIRRYGRDITADDIEKGRLFAGPGEKGLLRDVLKPGNYRINPFAFDIEIHPAMEVPAGFVGIVSELAGVEPKDPGAFVVSSGEKGVQPVGLQPGIYYVNPYAQRIDLMDVRSQRHEMIGDGALRFPTSDGFDMRVLLVVEWAVEAGRAPEVLVRVGEQGASDDSNEVLQKIVVPALRGYGRIIGSQYSALDYISGASRITFQSNLFDRVKTTCASKGVLIKSLLIGDISPPEEIAQPIRDREIAAEELSRNQAQIEQARAEQNLARTDAMIAQEQRRVEAETVKLQAIIGATNRQSVALVQQNQKLSVAKTDLEAAQREAEALRARGKAAADVTLLGLQAEAAAVRKSAEAFGSGKALSEYELSRAMAGKITSVFTTDDGEVGKLVKPQ
ncbi:hypothetical protein GX586_12630 [bacterium]|nr:hypothetical protein [bacterium]